MVFVHTIISKLGEKEIFSKEKLTIMLFEHMCNIGNPNLTLAEKLAFLIVDKINANFSENVSYDKLDDVIKDVLLKENQTELLQAYIFKKSKPDQSLVDTELKEKMLKNILNLDDHENLSTKLINLNCKLNEIQNNAHEKINKRIFDYVREGVFYPSSKILKDISYTNHFSSSFVFQINDTLESIFDDLALSSKVQKYGSSIAINLSNIRSEKEIVKSINEKACGPIKVADLFISAKSMIGYPVNTSNNLFYLSIEHPDLISFINHNFSNNSDSFAILIPDRFIENYINGLEYTIDTNFGEKKINPGVIFDLICSKISVGDNINLIFTDNISKKNPISGENKNYLVSSVGYQPILDNNTFVSGVIDVSKLVNILGDSKTIDWQKLKTIIWDSIEFLDNVIDSSKYVTEQYTQSAKDYRQIYLSITGFGTLLSKLNIPYNSDDSILLADSISNFISYYSKLKSTELAKERGPFLKYIKSKYELPNFHFEKNSIQKTLFSNDLVKSKKLLKNMPLVDWTDLRNNIKKYGLRNSTTFGIIFSDFFSVANDCTNGINPILNYKPIYWINGYKSEKINKELSLLVTDLNENWNEDEIDSFISKDIKSIFVKAKDIDPYFLVRLQSVFEKNADGVADLIIYFNDNYTISDLKKLIIDSHKLGNSLFLPKKLNGHITEFNTEKKNKFMSL